MGREDGRRRADPDRDGRAGRQADRTAGRALIEPGGPFALACAELVEDRGFSVPYVELRDEAEREARDKRAASKTKYTCPRCGVNAWAKPEIELDCGACKQPMEAISAKVKNG